MDLFEYDKSEGVYPLCGVDEAGRGPLAGDVYAAAVIFPQDYHLDGLNDSKKLTEKKRKELYEIIIRDAVSYCVATASVAEIEELNILNASLLAMRRAVDGLSVTPRLALVDGNRNPSLSSHIHSRLVVKGDATSACIAAASVLAKVERDRYMSRLAAEYPQYCFEKHKGYGTALHYEKINEFGVSPVHRISFLKNMKKKHSPAVSPTPTQPASAVGGFGEALCCDYLKEKGYQILFCNYSCAWGEIDVIAKKGTYIAFVEVKTRSENSMVSPVEAVTPSKRRKIIKTATCYLNGYCGASCAALQPRFDIAQIYLQRGEVLTATRIEYIENAFGED